MDKAEIKSALLSLSQEEQRSMITEIENEPSLHSSVLGRRREVFNNKIGFSPHCCSNNYRKHGIDKGSHLCYCTSCKRIFTEYIGTWLSGIHKKDPGG